MRNGPWPLRAWSSACLGHGVHRQHVVAVDPHPGEAEAAGPLVERDAGLPLVGLGDGPLVVLAEEHDGALVHGREDERLVDVALGGRAVAEERDHRGVAVGVAGADVAVALDAHRVADRVQRLVADDDRVEVEVVLVRVPAAVVDPAEHPEQLPAGRPRGTRRRRARGSRETRSPVRRIARPIPTCAASWPSSPGHRPSSPWRCSAVPSVSQPPDQHHVAVERLRVRVGHRVDRRVVRQVHLVPDPVAVLVDEPDRLRATVQRGQVRHPDQALVVVEARVVAAKRLVDRVAHRHSFNRPEPGVAGPSARHRCGVTRGADAPVGGGACPPRYPSRM